MSERQQRMIDSAPDYYQQAQVYATIQKAVADEFDSQQQGADDLPLQLQITTATWGLTYWEQKLGIPTVEADGYEIRRSRVLSKWRGFGNFSAALIKSVCEAFTNGETDVTIDVAQQIVHIRFIGTRGIPPNLDNLKTQIANIVHAHLGTDYSFTYLTWDEWDGLAETWDQLDARQLTWDEFEKVRP